MKQGLFRRYRELYAKRARYLDQDIMAHCPPVQNPHVDEQPKRSAHYPAMNDPFGRQKGHSRQAVQIRLIK
jgi:hypothetical protein